MIAFLSGRYKEIERGLEREMKAASDEQRFEDAARERNRLRAIRSLLERQRVAHEGAGSLDAIAIAVDPDAGEANAQVFQVRDGVLSDRQSFYLDNAAGEDLAEVAEAFILQYYASAMSMPPLLVVQRDVGQNQRSPRRSARDAADRSRSGRPSAATSAGSSSSPSATRGWRSTRRSCAPSAGASSASRRSTGSSARSDSTRSRCGSSASTSRP